MKPIKDRHGRGLAIALYGADGEILRLDAARLEAALRLKRALPGKPVLCARALEKLFGLVPVRLEVGLWNGKKISFHVSADLGNFINDIDCLIVRDQYNAAKVKGGLVADAGANIGVFSLYARALGAKKVYAYEPVKETFELLKANLVLNRAGAAIKAVNIALGKEKGQAEIQFNTRGEGSAMIKGAGVEVNRAVVYSGRRFVPVAPLDSLVKGRLDFIKMDVEGYEANVLLGAAGLIRKYKPVLSFSAYHRKADKKELPKTVAVIRPDYAITLNTFAEHDFYCD